MASSAAKQLPALLLFRVREIDFHAALLERYRVLDFFTSGEALPAFLAAAAADAADPPRAALIVGGGTSARVDAAFLDAVPSLRFVFNTGAGMDHIDLGECARRGVAVANSGTVYSTDVADHAVGMLLDVLRRVSAAQRFLRRGLWPLQGDYHPLGTKVGGKRVGIIGLGNIGMLIAKRLQAFGCAISYNSRKPKESVSYKYFASVHDLASESDVLVVACALSKETRHVVNRDVLDALGKDGVVINIGRGPIIDEAELVAALKEGRIAGAGLDVFEKEPKVPAELFSMDNVVLTPHVAVFTTESRSDLRDVAIGNLEAFFAGKPLLTPVLPRSVADASSSTSLGVDVHRAMAPRPSRSRTPLRNGAGGQPSAAEGPMASDPHGDDAVFPLTGDDDLVAAGLSPEHDDDDRDPFAVFDDVTRGTEPPIDVDAVDAGPAATGTAVDSNTHTNSTGNGNVNGTPISAVSGLGKRKSKC